MISPYDWAEFGFHVVTDCSDDFIYDSKNPSQFKISIMNIKLFVLLSISLFSCVNGKQANVTKEQISQESIDNVNNSSVFGASSDEFNKLCASLEAHSIPIKYSFEFIIDLPKFKPLPKTLTQFFPAQDSANAKIAKMPTHNNAQIFMIAANEESGETLLYLCSITNEIHILPIFSASDYEKDGQLGTNSMTYEIAMDYEILITESFVPFESDGSNVLVLKKTNYTINPNGDFIEKK